MARRKTGFDQYFDKRMAEAEFAAGYKTARAEIDTLDSLIRTLDEVRVTENVSKAELARRIGSKPEIIRRLFTADKANPTVETVLKIATALGYELQLVPTTSRARRPRRMQDEASASAR